MSSQTVILPNTIHIRDFVDKNERDSTKAGTVNYLKIHSDINICQEDNFLSTNIIVNLVWARVRAYIAQEHRDLYIPDAIFYTDGRFSTATTDSNLELTV